MPSFIAKAIVSVSDGPKISTTQGQGAKATQTGEFVQSSVLGSGGLGTAQKRSILLRRDLINSAALTEIFVNETSERIFVDAQSTYFFELWVTGRGIAGANVGKSMTIKLEGIISKNTADGVGPAVMTAGSKTVIVKTDPALTWDIDSDALGEEMRVRVQGDAATTIRWFAECKIREMKN